MYPIASFSKDQNLLSLKFGDEDGMHSIQAFPPSSTTSASELNTSSVTVNLNQPVQFPQDYLPIYVARPEAKVNRGRKRLQAKQTEILTRYFSETPNPDQFARAKLAGELNLTSKEVQIWFQNRRAKINKEKKYVQKLKNIEKPAMELTLLKHNELDFNFNNDLEIPAQPTPTSYTAFSQEVFLNSTLENSYLNVPPPPYFQQYPNLPFTYPSYDTAYLNFNQPANYDMDRFNIYTFSQPDTLSDFNEYIAYPNYDTSFM